MKTTLFLLLSSFFSLISCHSISQKGINLIKEFEGCRLTAYQDSVGVWTIGYGTTSSDKSITGTSIYQGLTITQETADKWLTLSINNKYGRNVDSFDSIYHWNQNEFDALCSFAYNLGSINQLVDNGNRAKSIIPEKMLLYVKAGGQKLAGLVRRREAEVNLFKYGTYSSSGGSSGQASNSKCSSGNGICITTDACTSSGGSYVSGKCPNDPDNVKCCNKKCSYNGRQGECKFTGDCSGDVYSGLCPGNSNFKCCIPKTTTTSSQGESCSYNGKSGQCKNPNNCNGQVISGLCSGGNDNKCCIVEKCSYNGKSGVCKNPNNCSGQVISGLCSGSNDNKCCI